MKSVNVRRLACIAAAVLSAAIGFIGIPTLYVLSVEKAQHTTLLMDYLVNAACLVFLFALPALLLLCAFPGVKQRVKEKCRPLTVDTVGYCMLCAVGATVVASLLASMWQPYAEKLLGYNPETPPLPQPQNMKEWLLSLLCIAVAPAVCEELFFRGFVQTALGKWLPRAALWITAIVFSALHFELLSFPGLLLIGWTLGMLFEKRGLFASMFFHAAYNSVVLLLSVKATGIGLLGIFLSVLAYTFSVRALKKEDDHAFDGTGL